MSNGLKVFFHFFKYRLKDFFSDDLVDPSSFDLFLSYGRIVNRQKPQAVSSTFFNSLEVF